MPASVPAGGGTRLNGRPPRSFSVQGSAMLGPGVNEVLWTQPGLIVKRPHKLLIDLTGSDPNPGPEDKSWSCWRAAVEPWRGFIYIMCVLFVIC